MYALEAVVVQTDLPQADCFIESSRFQVRYPVAVETQRCKIAVLLEQITRICGTKFELNAVALN
jgi:hypothetical protein